jgi:hypothetical protein
MPGNVVRRFTFPPFVADDGRAGCLPLPRPPGHRCRPLKPPTVPPMGTTVPGRPGPPRGRGLAGRRAQLLRRGEGPTRRPANFPGPTGRSEPGKPFGAPGCQVYGALTAGGALRRTRPATDASTELPAASPPGPPYIRPEALLLPGRARPPMATKSCARTRPVNPPRPLLEPGKSLCVPGRPVHGNRPAGRLAGCALPRPSIPASQSTGSPLR